MLTIFLCFRLQVGMQDGQALVGEEELHRNPNVAFTILFDILDAEVGDTGYYSCKILSAQGMVEDSAGDGNSLLVLGMYGALICMPHIILLGHGGRR